MTDTGRRNFVQATLEDYVNETTSDGDGDEGEEDELDSCSSFSLQQCIDEFRARRIRRNSTHASEQRDEAQHHQQKLQHQTDNAVKVDVLADADLISQNLSNKEHERKCKPCKNGFCYCFTSDSGDGGCGAAANAARGVAYKFPNARRSRKSESGQVSVHSQQQVMMPQRHKERRSAPASFKAMPAEPTIKQTTTKGNNITQIANTKRTLTAISRLEASTYDAPLIHIVQELRDNCVISEVRVNKHKLKFNRKQDSKSISNSKKILKHDPETTSPHQSPTAPTIELVNKSPTAPPANKKSPKSIETLSGDSIPVVRLEATSKSPRKKAGAGRLLQKRLSHSNIQYKPRDFNKPPPKPPRASTGSQVALSEGSLTSTSPSLRKAERVVDEFLMKKGIIVPKVHQQQYKQRKSFPLTHMEAQMHLPSCPSLSDIERTENDKKVDNNKKAQKHAIKDITLGWQEPKVTDMLNYDKNGNRKEFKSQAAQAEPQAIGWQIPPKLSLDTVDGGVRHNLASNLETKDTPVKRQFGGGKRLKPVNTTNYKFGWSWATTPKCPRSFLRQSKKKILQLVTPKKDNRECTKFAARKTPYRNVGIQTSLPDFEGAQKSLSPPGSYHSAAVQTSTDVTPQYSTETNSQNNNNTSDSTQFDFTRKIHSPTRKVSAALRNTQRKLDFPSSVCGANSAGFCLNQASTTENAPSFGNIQRQKPFGSRTYRSYQTDLDQDVTLSKMGFILSKIRARLEASDEHAIRTFEEIERREQYQQQIAGFDCPDSHGIRRRTDNVNIAHARQPNSYRLADLHETIYSEIEEDSIHVTESPVFDNKTGIESSSSAAVASAASAAVNAVVTTTAIDFEMLYAKVNKPRKNVQKNNHKNNDNNNDSSNTYTPLAQLLHDSLPKQAADEQRLSIVMEPSISEDVSYSSPPIEDVSSQQTRYSSPTPSDFSHTHSLNNVRVREQHSPPKRNRYLSKSDLSLHRSEIFLENLCRSELIVDGDGTLERLEKVDNQCFNRVSNAEASDVVSYDAISYDEPNEAIATTSPMQTPQKFLTKQSGNNYVNYVQSSARLPAAIKSALNLNATDRDTKLIPTHSKSCPVTPQKYCNTAVNLSSTQANSQPDSLNESMNYELLDVTTRTAMELDSTATPATTATRYKRLKQALQKSFRKSKNFVKQRRASLPTATTITGSETATMLPSATASPRTVARNETPQPTQMATSCLNLDELFELDEAGSATEQIARAVSICRQLPELEASCEMVEAERLLLYSNLRREFCRLKAENAAIKSEHSAAFERRLSVQTMRLPMILETNLAGYFNYYFTITFECQGQIHSTQSTQYRHGEVVFQNCNFEFLLHRTLDAGVEEPSLNCKVFMLRLRKISVTTNEVSDMLSSHDVTPLPSTPLSSASSLDDIKSRFQLYASFSLNASNFKPYKLNENSSDELTICLSAFNQPCQTPLKWPSNAIEDSNGFLHVQDPHSLHNWNWRWCSLLGLQLQIWTDDSSLAVAPLMSLNLCDQVQTLPLTACSRELCARPRSFCVQCSTSKVVDAEIATAAVFFATDNDADLQLWLQHLNQVFNFIVEWLQ